MSGSGCLSLSPAAAHCLRATKGSTVLGDRRTDSARLLCHSKPNLHRGFFGATSRNLMTTHLCGCVPLQNESPSHRHTLRTRSPAQIKLQARIYSSSSKCVGYVLSCQATCSLVLELWELILMSHLTPAILLYCVLVYFCVFTPPHR